jgi:uncharacterized membrane protein YbhN (UPF0104 family)
VTDAALETTSALGVAVVEPALARRARRPRDFLRLLGAVLALVLLLGMGNLAVGTADGLEQDLVHTTSGLPHLALRLFTFIGGVGALALPVGLSLDLVLRRRSFQLFEAYVAATIGGIVAFAFRSWVIHVEPGRLVEALTKELDNPRFARSTPVSGLLVATMAFLVVAQIGGRRWWQALATVSLGSVALSAVLSGRVTGLSLLVSLLLGWAVGLAVRYVIGAATTRPPGAEIADALAAAGVPLVRLERIYDTEEPRRYLGHQSGGARVRVNVLDRDTYGSAMGYRLWRWLRVQGPVVRRSPLTVRSAVDHEALMALAGRAAGAPVPELLAVCEVGPFAAMVAYRDVEGQTLDQVQGDLTDQVLRECWTALAHLQTRRIVHRGLTAENILLGPDGVTLLGVATGDVAMGDVALRLDVAQMLTTLALKVGPERSVRSAIEVLGDEHVSESLPLLQNLVLGRSTRKALKQQKRLLHSLRDQVIALTPTDGDVEEIKLERLSARSVITVVGLVIAVYFLVTQFTNVDFAELARTADLRWVGALLVFTFVTYVAAAMTTVGFVMHKLSFLRTMLTQFAVSFTGLVAPTAVGTVALNVRFLERSGVEPAVAMSSVGLVQIGMFVSHILLIVPLGVLAGSNTESFAPSAGVIIAVLAVLVLAMIGVSLPMGRRLLQTRLRPVVRQVVPRLVAVFQTPSKLVMGLSGALLQNLAYIAALVASVKAFGGHTGLAAIAVVYLAGSVVGSALPTPGGIGGVEVTLTTALAATGLPGGIAVSAVLLFRLATFWLPIPIGWWSLSWLQRKGSL